MLKAFYLFELPIAPQNKKFVLLPFLFCPRSLSEKQPKVTATSSQLNELCKWVQPHLETEASLDEIRKAYDKLIHHIDYDIMKPSPHWEAWKKARGID